MEEWCSASCFVSEFPLIYEQVTNSVMVMRDEVKPITGTAVVAAQGRSTLYWVPGEI
jgi:hypothetical protein